MDVRIYLQKVLALRVFTTYYIPLLWLKLLDKSNMIAVTLYLFVYLLYHRYVLVCNSFALVMHYYVVFKSGTCTLYTQLVCARLYAFVAAGGTLVR